MAFVNLAHGVFAMTGGYVALDLMNRAGCLLRGDSARFFAIALVSMVLERVLYAGSTPRPSSISAVHDRPRFMAVAGPKFAWGPLPQPVRLPDYLRGQIMIAGAPFRHIAASSSAARIWARARGARPSHNAVTITSRRG